MQLRLWSWPWLWCSKGANCDQPGGGKSLPSLIRRREVCQGKLSSRLVSLHFFPHPSFVWCAHERDNRESARTCVCMRERFIIQIMSPYGTIWDSSLPLWSAPAFWERTFFQLGARGRRAALRPRYHASPPMVATAAAMQSSVEEHCQVYVLILSLSVGLLSLSFS